jgi:hypothetical protein
MAIEMSWACVVFDYCCKIWLYFESSIRYNGMRISVKVVLNIVNTKEKKTFLL